MENIYADFGKIIDNRYIKRDIEKSILNRINGKTFASFSLVSFIFNLEASIL